MIKLKNKFSCEYKSGNLLKKAAMFGLDARIALAIFGALSVISGASLYSAIQSARTESLRQALSEFSKAVESYYLDTGESMPLNTTVDSLHVDVSGLLSNSENSINWNGPYLQGSLHRTGNMASRVNVGISLPDMKKYYSNSFNPIVFTSFLRLKDTWQFNNSMESCENGYPDCHGLCTQGYPGCMEYTALYTNNGDSNSREVLFDIFKKLDDLVDNTGGTGTNDGKIRYVSSGSEIAVFYQGMPRLYK